jgi:hypothetical protein
MMEVMIGDETLRNKSNVKRQEHSLINVLKKNSFIKSNCKLEKLGTAQPTLALLARYHAISHYAITTSTSKSQTECDV